MGITCFNKFTSLDEVPCGGSFEVSLALCAEPDLVSNPAKIVLVLDNSGSMKGAPLAAVKTAAKSFIDIIDEGADGVKDGLFGGDTMVGLVTFNDEARMESNLSNSATQLKIDVDNIEESDGLTNTGAAFQMADAMLGTEAGTQKIIVLFTDGKPTTGSDPAPIAEQMKAKGRIIYCIGLAGATGLNEALLGQWSSDPDSAYVAIAPDTQALEDIFENLALNIAKTGATDIVITEALNPCFSIEHIDTPTEGEVNLLNPQTIRWSIDALGVSGSEGAELTMQVKHTGACNGLVPLDESLTYTDAEQNAVTIPYPEITIDCGEIITVEACPEPQDFVAGHCEDVVEADAGEVMLNSVGRIATVSAVVRNVCPNRRVALGIVLNELDGQGNEYPRGLKTVVIPAHDNPSCVDMQIRGAQFVLPEALDVSGGSTTSICNERYFRARLIAHYIDHEYSCEDITP